MSCTNNRARAGKRIPTWEGGGHARLYFFALIPGFCLINSSPSCISNYFPLYWIFHINRQTCSYFSPQKKNNINKSLLLSLFSPPITTPLLSFSTEQNLSIFTLILSSYSLLNTCQSVFQFHHGT